MTLYRFDNYQLRNATQDDILMATAWTSADPWHATTTPPEFWLSTQKGIESYVLEDRRGPIFFFRMTRLVRLDIQFAPEETDPQRTRTRAALLTGVNWLARTLPENGTHQLIFNSQNPELIQSAERRLGFHRSPDELVRDLFVRKEADSVRSHAGTDGLAAKTS